MKKVTRASVVAVVGVTVLSLGLAIGGGNAPGVLAVRYARPSASAALERGPSNHPESVREMAAAQASQLSRSGSYGADVVSARIAAFKQAMAVRTATGTYGNSWKELGPTTYDASPLHDGMTINSGRVDSIAVDPRDVNRVWIGTASGGVWYTSDAGAHWTPKFDDQPSLVIGALAIDPEHPDTVYVGTGDNATGGYYVFPGVGLFVTRDGGTTWTRPAKNLRDASTVYHIEVSGPRVFVASNKGLFVSTDSGNSFTDVRLPTNAAHTAPGAGYLGSVVTDVRVQPGHPNVVTAVVGWRAGKYGNPHSEGNGLYRSTAFGAPGSWTPLASNLGYASPSEDKVGRTALAYDPEKPDVLWALVEDPGKFRGNIEGQVDSAYLTLALNPLNGVYRSEDNGATWVLKATAEVLARSPGTGFAVPAPGLPPIYAPGIQAWYNEWIAVDPTSSGNVLVGLEEIYQSTANADSNQGLAAWKTVGRYWNQCLSGTDQSIPGVDFDPGDCTKAGVLYPGATTTHPDQHAVQMVKTASGVRIYAGNDGGMFRQDVAAAAGFANDGWTPINNGLGTLQPYYAVMSKDGTVYAGLQDNGTAKIPPNSTSGMEVYGGDGNDVAVEPDNSDHAWEEYTYGNIRYTKDGGKTWTDVPPAFDGAQFTQAFEMDPLDPNHIVLPGLQVLETDKGVETHCQLDDNNADTDTEAMVFKGGPTCDWMLSVDLANLDPKAQHTSGLDVRGAKIYLAYCGVCDVLTAGGGDPGKFHNGIATNVQTGCEPTVGSNQNGCWHAAAAHGLPKRYISDVAMDPADDHTIYVTLSGWSRKWYVPGKNDPGVGAGQVYVSHDAGEHFTNITGNLPDIPANAALVRGDRVYVADDMGVYTALKGSSTWERLGAGLPNAPASDLELNPQGTKLVVATYGRGVWVYDFGATVAAPAKTKVLGKKTTQHLPATGSEETATLGVLLIACALMLARRERRS